MVEVPIPTMVITFFTMVATSVLELVYVKAPLLLVVGEVIVNAAFPNTFAGTEKLVIVVVALPTTKDVVIDADVLFSVLA